MNLFRYIYRILVPILLASCFPVELRPSEEPYRFVADSASALRAEIEKVLEDESVAEQMRICLYLNIEAFAEAHTHLREEKVQVDWEEKVFKEVKGMTVKEFLELLSRERRELYSASFERFSRDIYELEREMEAEPNMQRRASTAELIEALRNHQKARIEIFKQEDRFLSSCQETTS